MHLLLDFLRSEGRTGRLVIATPAPVEARAVLDGLEAHDCPIPPLWGSAIVGEAEVLHVGVGKANAAGAIAARLAREACAGVINLGIAGALPGLVGYRAKVGLAIAGLAVQFSDEGIWTESGYQDVAEIGFPLDPQCGSTFQCYGPMREIIGLYTDASGTIASVSTCSANDSLAREIARRSDAVCEEMEGAAIALVCRRMGVPFAAARTISNLTGSRTHQGWDIARATARLTALVRSLNRTA